MTQLVKNTYRVHGRKKGEKIVGYLQSAITILKHKDGTLTLSLTLTPGEWSSFLFEKAK